MDKTHNSKGGKSIKSLLDFELEHLNVIVGANGSGENNFVQLFEMLRAISLKGFQSLEYKNDKPCKRSREGKISFYK